jgi:hypothetical protein
MCVCVCVCVSVCVCVCVCVCVHVTAAYVALKGRVTVKHIAWIDCGRDVAEPSQVVQRRCGNEGVAMGARGGGNGSARGGNLTCEGVAMGRVRVDHGTLCEGVAHGSCEGAAMGRVRVGHGTLCEGVAMGHVRRWLTVAP